MEMLEIHPSTDRSVTKPSEKLKKFISSIDPIELILLVIHKWPILVFTVGICTAIAYFYAKSADYIYRAVAKVEVYRLNDPSAETEYDRIEGSNRQITIMTGKMLHKELIAKLSVKWKNLLEGKDLSVPFSVKPQRGTRMINLSVDSKNPEYALDYLQGILGSYRAYRQRERNEINENAIAGLRSEETRVLMELNKIKGEIEKFELENQILLGQEREQLKSTSISELLSRLQAIKTERLILEYQNEKVVDSDLINISETIEINQDVELREFILSPENQERANILAMNTSLSDLASDSNNEQTIPSWEEQKHLLASLKNQYQQELNVLQKTHPKMIELKKQIETLEFSLEKRLEFALGRLVARHQALKNKEESIEKTIQTLKDENLLNSEKTNRYLLLKSRQAHFEKKYDQIYKRILANAETLDDFSFLTIQEPYVLGNPVAPDKLMILAIGPAVGLGVGIVFILLRWFLLPVIIVILKEYKAQYKATLKT